MHPKPDLGRVAIFVPLPGFSMLSFAAALDPLRSANRMCGRDYYKWLVASQDGSPVTASNGLALQVDDALQRMPPADLTLAFLGVDLDPPGAQEVMPELRRRARNGEGIGGVSAGPWVLARAGLLDGYRCTVHWEYRAAFARLAHRAIVTDAPFEVDRNRYTSGGGTASIDMMLHLIEGDLGHATMRAVANQLQHERQRSNADRQRPSTEPDLTGKPDSVRQIVRLMADHIEEPLSTLELAAHVGLSVRQIERLFQRYVKQTPSEYYIALRLSHARELLIQTDGTVLEVAISTGFASQSHFAQSYRAAFGCNPSEERRKG